jgi:hypothetical protein
LSDAFRKAQGIDEQHSDKLSAINAELIANVKWVLERQDLDAAARLISDR